MKNPGAPQAPRFFLFLTFAAAALGCTPPPVKIDTAPPPPQETPKDAKPPQELPPDPAEHGPEPTEAATTPEAPPSSCPYGLAEIASSEIATGSPMFFYEDRPSLQMIEGGAGYVYLDHDSTQGFVARLDASGAKKSVRKIDFPDKHERSHVVGAFRGKKVAVATAVYHVQRDADIEVSLLDENDKVVWTSRVDPSPELDGTPAIVWGEDEIALVWTRGPYPSHNKVMFARLDPKTGKTKDARQFAASTSPGGPALVWDGKSYWVAWQANTMRNGITLARATPKGEISAMSPSKIEGVNPFLLPTPLGLALAYDEGRTLGFVMLDAEGKTKAPPVSILRHPDPIGSARRPTLAFDGKRFAIAYEVSFHASVMIARQTEARVAIVDPNGAASPSIALHPDTSAGEMPAVAWTGKDWLVVYNRDRLQQGKTPHVVATRLACQAEPPQANTKPAGPCDLVTRKAPESLRLDPRKMMAAAARLDDGGFALLEIALSPQTPVFVRVDKDGKETARLPLPSTGNARHPAVARGPAGFAAAWVDDNGTVEVALLDEAAKNFKMARLTGDPLWTSDPGLVFTPKGLVVAYSRGTSIASALLDSNGKILSAPASVASSPYPAGRCALGRGPAGLLLAFTTGTDISESSVIRVAKLDDAGKSAGSVALATAPHGFSQGPVVLGKPSGFLLLSSGPFTREVNVTELGPKGDVIKPDEKLLTSYGLTTYGAFLSGSEASVFALDGTSVHEKRVCVH